MDKFCRIALCVLALCWVWVVAFSSCSAMVPSKTAEILLTIIPGSLTIGIWDEEWTSEVSLDLEERSVSFEDQETSARFSVNFWVKDLKGAKKGYYATVQSSDLVWDVGWTEYKIPAGNIRFTANEKEWDDWKLAWVPNSEVVVNGDNADISEPFTYFDRAMDSTPWVLGKYGTKPTINLTIPANTPATSYKGTLTYTLIDRDNQPN